MISTAVSIHQESFQDQQTAERRHKEEKKEMEMKHVVGMFLALCLLFTMMPAAFAAEGDGWRAEDGGWRYYRNGAPLTNVNWIEEEQNFYLFDEDGLLQTGDADGGVWMNGNLYYINPAKNPLYPSTCHAVRNYTRSRDAGVTYYDSNGITFVGWMRTADGGRMYQTRITRPGQKDLYIYVWRGQYLPAGRDPETFESIPAGWYLFGEDGVLVGQAGWHDSEDGCAYRTNEQGMILEQGPRGTRDNPRPALDPNTMTIDEIIDAANKYAYSKNLGINPKLAIGRAGYDNPINTSILSNRSIMSDLFYCIDQIAKMLGDVDIDHPRAYKIVVSGDRIYVLYG